MSNNKISKKLEILSKFNNNIFQKVNVSSECLSNISYKDIKPLLDNQNMSLIYFNKNQIHLILYEEEEVININFDPNKNLRDLFFLSLLIDTDKTLINYIYEFNFIEKIIEIKEKCKNIYIQSIISKVITCLIDNYKGLYDNDDKLDKIEKNNIETINELKAIFKELNQEFLLNDIKNKDIDKLYSEIIILNLNNIEDDVETIFELFDELDLENIELTETMYSEIMKNLRVDYKIKNKEDLFNKEKIDYYYILLKYIFKNSIYLNNIKYFSETKSKILNIMKNEINFIKLNFDNLDEIRKSEMKYIINSLTGSKYYERKINNNNIINNNIIDIMENDFDKNYNFNSIVYRTNNHELSTLKLPTIKNKEKKLDEILDKLEYRKQTHHTKKRKKSKKIKKSKNSNNIINCKENNKIKPKKEEIDDSKIIYYMDIFDSNDIDKKGILFNFIKYTNINLEKIIINDNTYGYKINKDIIALIKNKYNQNELSNIINEIEIKKFKIILEISNINDIITFPSESKNNCKNNNFITICKIIYDNTHINYNSNENFFNDNLFNIPTNSNKSILYSDDEIDNEFFEYNNNGDDNENKIFIYQSNRKKERYEFFNFKNYEITYIYPIFSFNEKENLTQTLYFFALCFEKDASQIIKLFRIINGVKINLVNNIDISDVKEKIYSFKQLVTGRFVLFGKNGVHYIYSCPNLTRSELFVEIESNEMMFG